jgi:hypothetical protein
LGGYRIKESETNPTLPFSLAPVLHRTLGVEWQTVFEVVQTKVFRLPTLWECELADRNIRAYGKRKEPTRVKELFEYEQIRTLMLKLGLGNVRG